MHIFGHRNTRKYFKMFSHKQQSVSQNGCSRIIVLRELYDIQL